MTRKKRLRKVVAPPGFKSYRPYGADKSPSGCVELLYEEYEAIKLADYDLMNHEKASKIMGISRPTFARIYKCARMKIAGAFVENKEIKTVYGNAWMDKSWYICDDCNARFNIPTPEKKSFCPVCSSEKIEDLKNQI